MLVTAEYINTYPPYYPNQDPSLYFDFQLLSTNGSTVLASTPLKSWGDMPTSLYLSSSMVSSLTKGSQYYVGVVGTGISGTPAGYYQLQASDWQGSSKKYLDNWVLLTAGNMGLYYDTNFISYIAGLAEFLMMKEV